MERRKVEQAKKIEEEELKKIIAGILHSIQTRWRGNLSTLYLAKGHLQAIQDENIRLQEITEALEKQELEWISRVKETQKELETTFEQLEAALND